MAEKSGAKGAKTPPGKHPMDVFRDAVKKILSVPKSEINRRIEAERERNK